MVWVPGEAHFGVADATRLPLADDSVQLVVTSPPYMDARTYGIGAQRKCEDWIDWMLVVVRELSRVCVGPVIVNCAGVTRDRNYWPGPEGLLYRAWQAGIECYRPLYWHRVGIPGSGGDDWLRADIEYCLLFKRPGKLPVRNLDAIGHPPKWAPGGEMSHRLGSGARVNQWGHSVDSGATTGPKDDITSKGRRPSHRQATGWKGNRRADGSTEPWDYIPPVYANPGNLLKTTVGGGQMGHPLAHENEAPFPESLAEFLVKGWSRPGDKVLDPFSGSGTTACVAARLGRIGVGFDLRPAMAQLGARRFATPYAKKTKARKTAKGQMAIFALTEAA